MSAQPFIVLTEAQRDAAKALNRADYAVEPVLIDNAAANALGFGTLVGLYVLPARVLTDPNYTVWASLLSGLPASVMDGAHRYSIPRRSNSLEYRLPLPARRDDAPVSIERLRPWPIPPLAMKSSL